MGIKLKKTNIISKRAIQFAQIIGIFVLVVLIGGACGFSMAQSLFSDNTENINGELIEYEHVYEKVYVPGLNTARAGDMLEFGGIKWRVLGVQHTDVLVLSEYILGFQEQHPFTVSEHGRGMSRIDTTIDYYLNGAFLLQFSGEERARIVQSGRGVFLLTKNEVMRHFGNSNFEIRSDDPTTNGIIYDQYNENRIAFDLDGVARWWWLSTPGAGNTFMGISSDGIIRVTGVPTDFSCGGVRPALWLRNDN